MRLGSMWLAEILDPKVDVIPDIVSHVFLLWLCDSVLHTNKSRQGRERLERVEKGLGIWGGELIRFP